ncbi:hypothetical protein GCM10010954_23840 [Halobacillus andaensis]|uniref:Uncharacterized protein n=1 Tax=Halobacillus andaensis TaxID=1176239 RepID=A0A917B805_HALAA|nr:hypothetical protein [Halobacillus andaensis]MBP2006026.1 hypothetical protein [Halobacillus andaensis]GGF24177.1 hypothetical protein GCM10010954_23840 [Halobacillus andaensis]
MSVGIILKFVDSQFTESTLDGELFFCRSGYFIDLEKKENNKGIGDSREGSWSDKMGDNSMILIETENGEKIPPLMVSSGAFFRSYEGIRGIPICCFVYLTMENDFYEENGFRKIKPEIVDELEKQFGDKDVIFINPSQFAERLDKAIKDAGFSMKRGLVHYYDERKEPHPLALEDYEKDPADALFYKRKSFEFQKEFRVVLKSIEENDVFINLGDIRDIARKIDKDKISTLRMKKVNYE